MLDGIQLNGMCGNGSTQAYTNTQSYEEMVFQTSGAGADVSAPGVQQNMIPRQGGNQFHGSFNALRQPQLAGRRLTPELVAEDWPRETASYGLGDSKAASAARSSRTGCGGSPPRADRLRTNRCPTRCIPTAAPASTSST